VLISKLLEQEFHVTVLDNFMYSQTSLSHLVFNPQFELIKGDIRDKSLVKHVLNRSDIIIPLAAIVGAPACGKDPNLARSVNNEAMKFMISEISTSQLVVMPTTNSAYGRSNSKLDICDEESPLNPLSLYARDKVEIEEILLGLENAVSFRLATVFGLSPRMRLDLLVNDFVFRALNDKFLVLFEAHFRRNYIHVLDVVEAFTLALANPDAFVGNVFNVGLSSANLSKFQLCEQIKKQIPDFVFFESNVGTDPDQRDYIVSNNKIESRGFRPSVTLDQGIEELIKGLPMFRHDAFTNK
jgi:nucleoside-diphosphate-sugar epimerase